MAAPTVILGIDFTEGSRRAMQAVEVLARAAGARLRLVHAFPPAKARLAGAAKQRVADAIARAESDESQRLSQAAEHLRQQGFQVDTVAVAGKPAAVILEQARRGKAGLVAVGTSGRRGVGGVFLGSVAQAVLRDSPIPVLVTPSRHRAGARRKAGPVLVAVSLDAGAPGVVQAAAGLAGDLGVALHLFHAVPLPFAGGALPDGRPDLTPSLLAAEEELAAQRLTALAATVQVRGKVHVSIGLGDPATHLLAQAQALNAAAIVLGRRKVGRRLGSVSAAVVQAADRPVIVVPAAFAARTARAK